MGVWLECRIIGSLCVNLGVSVMFVVLPCQKSRNRQYR